ncbi:hypothetical protein A9B99_03745 [Mangrovibacter phragmitis]|uniref:Uncharacterized protein n=1 Tax=Mangrovibacter phragmitis TaxID=1691903 RepID=A0A1B7L905_9ENTR|nr:hypothetical protein [Mangrovibacter phragmitis]OAT78824.1 hypothetical protein A9B99_03745 [Mangrovibacter phragmitis]
MNQSTFSRDKVTKGILFLFVFLTTAVFFFMIHPVTIISGDDWINLSTGRQAYPQWHGFNPIKVVPELSFPLFGNMASALLVPLGFTFLQSVAYITALLVAVLVVVFLYQAYELFNQKLNYSSYISSLLVLFYFLAMFGLFRTLNNNQSPYMLWEQNITCYYHYVVPALINGAISLYFLRKGRELTSLNKKPVFAGFFVLVIYFCIFSNIFSNVFFAVLCGVVLLLNLLENKFNIIETCRLFPYHVLTLVLWLISAVYEMNGGRADRMGKTHLDVIGAFHSLGSLLKLTELTFTIVLGVGVLSSFVIFMHKATDKQQSNIKYILGVSVLSCVISLVALILICSKASAGYATRPAAMWGFIMYFIIAASIGLGWVTSQYRALLFIAPVIVFFLVNKTTDQGPSLRESHNGNVPYEVANAVSQYMIDQVVSAVNANERNMVLHVPKGDNIDNWPFPITRGKAISQTLKSNGVIPRNIGITIKPDIELNKKFGMPVD